MVKTAARKPPGAATGAGAGWLWNVALVGNVAALAAHAVLVNWYPESAVVQGVSKVANAGAAALSAGTNDAAHNPELSERYFERASKYMASKGEGYLGWLNLLAAYDLNPRDETVLANLVQNYRASDLTYLALDELNTVLENDPDNSAARSLTAEVRSENPAEWESYQKRKARSYAPSTEQKLGKPQFTIPFATAFARWDLTAQFPDYATLNREFYDATVIAYNEMKKDWVAKQPGISDTELNHKFFQWQMKILRETGDYWNGYTELRLFRDLMETMRHGAAQVLEAFGFDRETANRKAHHEVIFWASVHSDNSVHEPHQTEDSLIGGVYYVTSKCRSPQVALAPVERAANSPVRAVPPNSGVLDMFDPRGKIRGGTSLPEPPFHRVYTVQPKEGMLVLFPGWLVHTVRESVGLNVARDGYRVSISVNLKGEWQDTTKLKVEDVELFRPGS